MDQIDIVDLGKHILRLVKSAPVGFLLKFPHVGIRIRGNRGPEKAGGTMLKAAVLITECHDGPLLSGYRLNTMQRVVDQLA
jgi:hypothetical protein